MPTGRRSDAAIALTNIAAVNLRKRDPSRMRGHSFHFYKSFSEKMPVPASLGRFSVLSKC
jgi:hypothetical protein